ncbi:MAG TPA: cysteine hydrolase [Candidatus Saccharimonadales bacterium]
MDLATTLNKSSTVLLVVDKQAGYFNPQLVKERYQSLPDNSNATLEAMDRFIEDARAAEIEVVWTQMVEDVQQSPLPISEIMRNDPEGVGSITKPGDPSFEIYGRVVPLPGEKVITKYRYDAFSKTDLAEYLKSLGAKTVILIGGYASRCVLSSVVGANGEDLFCVVPRGLVLNQKIVEHEVETLYSIVNAIFGLTPNPDDILSAWTK